MMSSRAFDDLYYGCHHSGPGGSGAIFREK
jgi:hypothetical protein